MQEPKSNQVGNPIILFGTGRSGTTIFMDALFQHQEIAFLPNHLERKPSWVWLNYLRNLHDNSYFRILKKRDGSLAQRITSPFLLKPVEGYCIWKHILPEHIDFSRSFLHDINLNEEEKKQIYEYFEDVIAKQSKSRLALKITGPGRLFFLSRLFPSAKFIWLKREFIPTLNSFLTVDFWKDRRIDELWWKSDKLIEKLNKLPEIMDDPVLFTAFQIHEILESIGKSIDELNLNIYTINYEDFTEQPINIMNEALEFCELSDDHACFSFLKNTTIENRNKSDSDYFDEQTLFKINKLRNKLRNLG